jgi:hypothetical protein
MPIGVAGHEIDVLVLQGAPQPLDEYVRRRAVVTGVRAWEPSCRAFGIANILRKRQPHPSQGRHPVDVGIY